MWGYLASFVVGAVTYRAVTQWLKEEPVQENRSLKRLKNALLTFALVCVNGDKIEKQLYNTRYDQYDGETLPPLSGCDMTNACFSYMLDKEEFRKSPWYTVIMEQKLEAIDKYLDAQLGTDDQAVAFFERFIERAVEPDETGGGEYVKC